MNTVATRILPRRRIPAWLQGLVAAQLALCPPGAAAAEPDDAVGREFSVFAGSVAAVAVGDAVSREFSVFAGSLGMEPVADAASREFSVFAGSLAPVAVRDAVAREFSIMAGGAPIVPPSDAVAREFSVLVPTAPVISLNATTLVFREGDGPLLIDGASTVEDPDSTDLGGGHLRVEVLEGGAPGDLLLIREIPGGTITLGPEGEVRFGEVVIGVMAGGAAGEPLVVTLNANASIAASQALVRSIAFANPNRFPAPGLRQVGFTLADGTVGEGPTASRGIRVEPVNHAPLGFAFPSPNTTQGGTVGVVDGVVTYTPPPGFTGTDRFSYTLSDPFGGVGTATVMAFVRASDDPSVTVLELGMTGDGFALAMVGLPGRAYRGFASDDLSDWVPFALEEADEIGLLRFVDPEA
nr:cadherin-like domain-containing protein [Akkermansiaceae bacterium]